VIFLAFAVAGAMCNIVAISSSNAALYHIFDEIGIKIIKKALFFDFPFFE
jgi:hypothetical protein